MSTAIATLSPQSFRSSRAAAPGFTMTELMVVIALVAILLGVAAPSFRDFGRESSLRAKSGELASDLNFARLEAIKRNARVLVCARSATGNGCMTSTDWQSGWIVCYDANGDDVCDPTTPNDPNPLKVIALPDTSLRLASTVPLVRFNPVGTSSGQAVLTLSGTWSNTTTRIASIAGTGYVTTRKE